MTGVNFSSQCQVSTPNSGCENGTMALLTIEPSFETIKLPKFKKRKGFYIEVDPGKKSQNFITDEEYYFRTQSVTMDTTDVGYVADWDLFNLEEKLAIVKRKKKQYKELADKIHMETNQGQQLISLVNSNKRGIYFPSICSIPLIVLQAKNTNGEWKTIRFIQFASCGSCYSTSLIPRSSKLDFIVQLPDQGDYSTMLRFKMLYKDQFIFSNEFTYDIDYCDFFEESDIGNNCIYCKATKANKLEIKPEDWW